MSITQSLSGVLPFLPESKYKRVPGRYNFTFLSTYSANPKNTICTVLTITKDRLQ